MSNRISFKSKVKSEEIEELAVEIYKAEQALKKVAELSKKSCHTKSVAKIYNKAQELQRLRYSLEDDLIFTMEKEDKPTDQILSWALTENGMKERGLI